MDFVTAEEKFNELQARIRRGEPMSEDQYQEELAQLMVQDESGVFWSLEPGTGRWLYFNGTEWMPGTPPRQSNVPPAAPAVAAAAAAATYEPPASIEPQTYTPPAQEPAPVEPVASEPPSYYVPSDQTRPIEYSGSYTGESSYPPPDLVAGASYVSMQDGTQMPEPDAVPTYVRMPEPETTAPMGGIPPRPVREASPLAVPGGERAWLPFAFGALVLLLCAVVLFFGVRGLPQFSGGTASQQATDEPTEEVTEVLPTETVVLAPTKAPPTAEPTQAPQPTPEPQPVTAVATDVLNIRQGPARTTPSLGKLQPNQTVTVVGRNGDGTWLQIQIPEQTGSGVGWVSAEFVTVSGDINSLPVTSGDSGNNQPSATETPTG